VTARADRDIEQSPLKFKIEASRDGLIYEKLSKIKTGRWNLGEERVFSFRNGHAWPIYRLVFGKSDSNFVAVSKLKFGP
jgi:hypothetical protein